MYTRRLCPRLYLGDSGLTPDCRNQIVPKIVLKCTAISQSRNEALNYVENTMYFETSDLKIHFLMVRNSEISINIPTSHFTLVNINR